MKQSFILHIDSLCVLDELSNEQRGELFNAIYYYHIGKEIELSPMVKVAFSQFKNQFKRDEEKYTNTVEKRKQAGAMGGKQRVANQANATKCKQNIANQAVNDSKNKSDSVNDSKNKDIIVEVKKTRYGTSELSLPAWLDKQTWNKWILHRQEIKKKLTTTAIKEQIEFLSHHIEDHVAIINASIMNGWQGLFEIKNKQNQSKKPHPYESGLI